MSYRLTGTHCRQVGMGCSHCTFYEDEEETRRPSLGAPRTRSTAGIAPTTAAVWMKPIEGPKWEIKTPPRALPIATPATIAEIFQVKASVTAPWGARWPTIW